MNITVISVGKIKEKYFTAAIDEYSKRLSRFAKLNIIEVADEKIPDNASEKEMEQIKKKREIKSLQNFRKIRLLLHFALRARNILPKN